jgi:hypothetical protein
MDGWNVVGIDVKNPRHLRVLAGDDGKPENFKTRKAAVIRAKQLTESEMIEDGTMYEYRVYKATVVDYWRF